MASNAIEVSRGKVELVGCRRDELGTTLDFRTIYIHSDYSEYMMEVMKAQLKG
ncbi:hypothetical protein KQI52_06355 [bacterium]|nr:hypothetical protein [bacterium]